MGKFLIIGGSSGIGLKISESLVALDHSVLSSYNMNKPSLGGDTWNQFHFDALSSDIQGEDLPDTLDGLAYCPGTINLGSFARFSVDDYLHDYKIQVLGAIKVMKTALPALKKSKAASVLLFSSVAVQKGFPFHAQVAASKGAIEGLVKALAAELAPNIRVNAIAPSLTDTPLASKLLSSAKQHENYARSHPMKRIGTTEDIANAAIYLLCQESNWVTGQILHVDGGLSSLTV